MAAFARHGSTANTAASSARANLISKRMSLAATTTAPCPTFSAARTGARLIHVLEVVGRDRIAAETHDRIGQVVPLVRAHPRLERRATAGRKKNRQQNYNVAVHSDHLRKRPS